MKKNKYKFKFYFNGIESANYTASLSVGGEYEREITLKQWHPENIDKGKKVMSLKNTGNYTIITFDDLSTLKVDFSQQMDLLAALLIDFESQGYDRAVLKNKTKGTKLKLDNKI